MHHMLYIRKDCLVLYVYGDGMSIHQIVTAKDGNEATRSVARIEVKKWSIENLADSLDLAIVGAPGTGSTLATFVFVRAEWELYAAKCRDRERKHGRVSGRHPLQA